MRGRSRRRGRRRWLALIWVGFVLLCGIALSVSMALRPEAIEARVRAALDAALRCDYRLDHVSASFGQGVVLEGFSLHEPGPGGRPIATAGIVRIVPRLWSLLTGRFRPETIAVSDLDLHVERREGGGWNLADVLEPGAAPSAPSAADRSAALDLAGVFVSRARVSYRDAATFGRPVAEELEKVWLSLVPYDGGRAGRFEIELVPQHAARLSLRGGVELREDGPVLQAEVEARRIDLAPALERYGGEAIAARLREHGVSGAADVKLTLARAPGVPIEVRAVEVRLEEARAAPRGSPFPIRGLQGLLRWRDGEGSVELRGDVGDSPASASAAFATGPDGRCTRWSAAVRVPALQLDEHTASRCEPGLRKTLEIFNIEGSVGVEVAVPAATTWPPELEEVGATVRLHGVRFRAHHFPYQLEDGRAVFHLEKGRVGVEDGSSFRAANGRVRIVRCEYDAHAGGAFDIGLAVEQLTIDDRLRDACPPSAHDIWNQLHLAGKGDAAVHISKPAVDVAAGEEAHFRVVVEVQPLGASLRYAGFPYAVSDITGHLVVDTGQMLLRIDRLDGFHGRNKIAGWGDVHLSSHGPIDLHVQSIDAEVDADLLDAVPANSHFHVRDFNPTGMISLNAAIERTAGAAETTVGVDVEFRGTTLQHAKFPFPLQVAAGHLVIDKLRTGTFERLRTAPGAKPQVEFSGKLSCYDDRAELSYDFEVHELVFDDTLQSALSERLRRVIRQAGLSGSFSGRLAGKYVTYVAAPERNTLHYDLYDIRSEDATVDFGLRVTEVKGRGEVHGVSGPGDFQEVRGEIEIERSRFNRLRLEGGEVVFSYGALHPLLDPAAPRTARLPPPEYKIADELRDAVLGGNLSDTLQISVRSDDFYGGMNRGFLFIDTGARAVFGGHFTASDIAVGKATKDVFGHEGETEGDASGEVTFHGKVGDWRSLSGKGNGKIVDARLAQVPLFHGLLDLVVPGSKGAVFSELSLPYTIGEGRFHSSDITIQSGIMKLWGGGTLDFEGNLDLLLQPVIIPLRIPILDGFITGLKKLLSEIQVRGTLARPEVKFRSAGMEFEFDVQPKKEDSR